MEEKQDCPRVYQHTLKLLSSCHQPSTGDSQIEGRSDNTVNHIQSQFLPGVRIFVVSPVVLQFYNRLRREGGIKGELMFSCKKMFANGIDDLWW